MRPDGSTNVTERQLAGWLDGYRKAWQDRDASAAMALFTADAEYHEVPFAQPYRGREAVGDYWREATSSQRDVSFSHEIVALCGSRGVARWTADFHRITSGRHVWLDGILVLTFDEHGLCRVLREWWHLSEEPKPEGSWPPRTPDEPDEARRERTEGPHER